MLILESFSWDKIIYRWFVSQKLVKSSIFRCFSRAKWSFRSGLMIRNGPKSDFLEILWQNSGKKFMLSLFLRKKKKYGGNLAAKMAKKPLSWAFLGGFLWKNVKLGAKCPILLKNNEIEMKNRTWNDGRKFRLKNWILGHFSFIFWVIWGDFEVNLLVKIPKFWSLWIWSNFVVFFIPIFLENSAFWGLLVQFVEV